MPSPAEIRFVGDESQYRSDRAHRDDGAILLTNTAREYDGRQTPDQCPRGPVEKLCESGSGRRAARPSREQIQRRKLQIDGQVDAQPQKRLDERITLIEIVEAVAGAHGVDAYQPNRIERDDDHALHRLRRLPVARWKENENHRSNKCVGETEAA